MDFDEYNESLMVPLSHSIAHLVTEIFPETVEIGEITLHRNVATSPDFTVFIEIVDKCMGDMYVANNGRSWKKEKAEEMLEPGLVYVWYSQTEALESTGCFLTFKPVLELYGKTLYLYEIQILPLFQAHGLGAKLMDCFHSLAKSMDSRKLDSSLAQHVHLKTEATSLTVFSANSRALTWYKRLGYKRTADSPVDRKMRNKVLKPKFYLLSRLVK